MTLIDLPSKQAAWNRRKSAENAEIGKPRITDAQREEGKRLWALCKDDLEAFNTLVFPQSTGLKPLGTVQKESIAHDQSVILNGGRVCKAEPRGYGKTSRCCNAALWGVLNGSLEMVPVFSANLEKSKNQIMARWKTELLNNERLFWMHPELVWPFRALGNKPQGAASQTFNGELTHIKWTADRIVFPHLPGVVGSGAVLIALPLKSCRGATHTTPDGTILRPDLCVFDDVQNDEDAGNSATVKKFEDLIDHTALMLGGHSQTMSAIMNCTVRLADDLSEKYLKKSSWRRVRYKMLTAPAKLEESFWLGEYAKVRSDYDPEDPDDQQRAHRAALSLYESKRAEADDGAQITWDWAYTWADDDPTEVSAIQHAYNIRIDLGEGVFASECQNEPLVEKVDDEDIRLRPDEVKKKLNSLPRGTIPADASKVIAFIDAKKDILYWSVVAFLDGFTGYVVDYGSFPDQHKPYYISRKPRVALQKAMKADSWEAGLYAGLDAITNQLMDREWKRADGAVMHPERIAIDHGWGEAKPTIDLFCRQSKHAAVILPSKGFYHGASSKSFIEYGNRDKGDRTSRDNIPWRVRVGQNGLRGLQFDSNWFKTFVVRRFKTPMGGRGCLSMFGKDPEAHALFADHAASETPHVVHTRNQTVVEWKQSIGIDNDFFDCIVGCHVAAAERGLTLHDQKPRPAKQVKKFSEIEKTRKAWTLEELRNGRR